MYAIIRYNLNKKGMNEMKVGKNSVISKLGSGCSRKAVLLDNGLVCKLPRYNNSFNTLGRPESGIFSELMEEFQENESVKKINKLRAKGFSLTAPCVGILVEYLFSLKIEGTEGSEYFAKCIEIKVRKKKKEDIIDIKGLYENALEKESKRFRYEYIEELPYEVEDLHSNNIVNGYIVDYAALEYRYE